VNHSDFHPDHLADMQKSGLNDDTIEVMGVYSVRPNDIPKQLGWNPEKVESLLAFPYPGLNFKRFKVFPSFTDKNGNKVKYLQRKGTGVHLYILPPVQRILANPTAPIYFTEGEKKSAKAVQGGIMTIALGGLWNFLDGETGEAIEEVDRIAWPDREVLFIPDSDVWARPDLIKAIYAFGKEIEERGAHFSVIAYSSDLYTLY